MCKPIRVRVQRTVYLLHVAGAQFPAKPVGLWRHKAQIGLFKDEQQETKPPSHTLSGSFRHWQPECILRTGERLQRTHKAWLGYSNAPKAPTCP